MFADFYEYMNFNQLNQIVTIQKTFHSLIFLKSQETLE